MIVASQSTSRWWGDSYLASGPYGIPTKVTGISWSSIPLPRLRSRVAGLVLHAFSIRVVRVDNANPSTLNAVVIQRKVTVQPHDVEYLPLAVSHHFFPARKTEGKKSHVCSDVFWNACSNAVLMQDDFEVTEE